MLSTPAQPGAEAAVAGDGAATESDMHGELLVPAGAELIGRIPASLTLGDTAPASTPAIESVPAAREN